MARGLEQGYLLGDQEGLMDENQSQKLPMGWRTRAERTTFFSWMSKSFTRDSLLIARQKFNSRMYSHYYTYGTDKIEQSRLGITITKQIQRGIEQTLLTIRGQYPSQHPKSWVLNQDVKYTHLKVAC